MGISAENVILGILPGHTYSVYPSIKYFVETVNILYKWKLLKYYYICMNLSKIFYLVWDFNVSIYYYLQLISYYL